jgi:hypothetical protein
MENIHLIPTDRPSRVYKHLGRELKHTVRYFEQKGLLCINQHIYITNDEEIKDGWSYDRMMRTVNKIDNVYSSKIILTTDQDLIADGVQAIDDTFLEWFVKNPSCEEVKVEEVYPLTCCIQKEGKTKMNSGCMERNRCMNYKIIIPQEEPKQRAKIH